MTSLEDDAQILSDFGLTYNQAKIYITVVKLGLASIGKVSKFSKVRREEVYRTLPKLEKMGLIEKVLGMPAKVRAIPVDDALALLIKQEQDNANKKLSELLVRKEKILKNFKADKGRVMEEEERAQFSLISEKAAILNKGASLLKSMKHDFLIVASRQKLTQFLVIYAELLKKAIKRGVKIRIVTEIPEEEDQIPRIMEEHISPGESVKLKYAETLPSHFMIVDNKEMMIATTTNAPLAEQPALWTNNGPLIEPLQRAFEDLWHSSINWAAIKAESEAEKVERFVRQLKPSDHIIFVYETSEAKFNVLFNYIKYGLENGEAALYVCSEADPGQIRNAMKLFGIDVEKYEKTGALNILHYTEFYIREGKFSIPNTLGLWNKFYKGALAKGFKGLRVTGETECFFKHNMVQDLMEYEKALHRVLEIPMIAICSYKTDMLNKADDPINLYSELARAHGTVLFTGIDNNLGRIEIRKP